MIKFLSVLAASWLLTSPALGWQLAGLGEFNFEALAPDVYVMHGPNEEPNIANQGFMNNPAIVLSKNGIILIDPGSTVGVGEQVLAEIEKISDKPILAVFNTHIHGDHWLANDAVARAYPKAPRYAHPNMLAQADRQGVTWLALLQQLTGGISAATRLTTPNQSVANADDIEIDGEVFRIHSSSASHTSTDIMIEHLQSKTLFLGDNGFNRRFGQFDTSSRIIGNIAALERATSLDIEQFVPGHGASGDEAQVVKPYLDYLKLLREVAAAGFEADLQGYEIKQQNLARFEPYRDWYGFEDYLGKHIDKMYLEVEALSW